LGNKIPAACLHISPELQNWGRKSFAWVAWFLHQSLTASVLTLYYFAATLTIYHGKYFYSYTEIEDMIFLDIGRRTRHVLDCILDSGVSVDNFRWEKDGITLRYPEYFVINDTRRGMKIKRLFIDVDQHFNDSGTYLCINGDERLSVDIIGGTCIIRE
jgi:hypothetical protein